MDELTQKEIEEYLRDLPKSILDLIQDKTWSKRVDEISVKYSLSEEQDTILKNLVLFVIIGAEEAENFKQSIKDELKISDLLTDQLVKDLDERVFQYAFSQIAESNKQEEILADSLTLETPPPQTETQGIRRKDENGLDNLRTMQGDIKSFKEPASQPPKPQFIPAKPVINTETQPKIEQVKTSEILPNKDNEYLPAKDDEFLPVLKGDNFIPHNLPGVEIEPVQKPIEVPRYTASPEALKNESAPTQNEEQNNLENIVSSKLNSTVSAQKETPKNYALDPYREPLE